MQFDKTWTKSKYIYLINIVKEHPCIWDQNHLSFKKIRVKNAAWNRVAELLSTDAADAREKWIDIVNQYRGLKISSLQNGCNNRPYYDLFRLMEFLDNNSNRHSNSSKIAVGMNCIHKKRLASSTQDVPKSQVIENQCPENKRNKLFIPMSPSEVREQVNVKSYLSTSKPTNNPAPIMPSPQTFPNTKPSQQISAPIIIAPASERLKEKHITNSRTDKDGVSLVKNNSENNEDPQMNLLETMTINRPNSIQKFMLSMADQLTVLDKKKQREAMVQIIQTVRNCCDS